VPVVTQLVGFVLLVIGIGTWLATGFESLTALIPAFFGLPILLLGLVAERREAARKHAMHGALLLALIALLATAPIALDIGPMGDASDAAVIESWLTAIVALVYLVVGVRSFVAARRA
jgi:hypothetical protein